MSYFLWSSMPDDELFALAKAERLREPAELQRQVVRMIVMVMVNCDRARCVGPKQSNIFWVLGDRLRYAVAANVTIDADDAIALRHDDMKVVADQENTESPLVPDPADQGIELSLTNVIDATNGLVENEQIGISDESASENDALQLATRQSRNLTVGDSLGTDLCQNAADCVFVGR